MGCDQPFSFLFSLPLCLSPRLCLSLPLLSVPREENATPPLPPPSRPQKPTSDGPACLPQRRPQWRHPPVLVPRQTDDSRKPTGRRKRPENPLAPTVRERENATSSSSPPPPLFSSSSPLLLLSRPNLLNLSHRGRHAPLSRGAASSFAPLRPFLSSLSLGSIRYARNGEAFVLFLFCCTLQNTHQTPVRLSLSLPISLPIFCLGCQRDRKTGGGGRPEDNRETHRTRLHTHTLQ